MSRRRRAVIIAVCLLLGAALCWIDHSFAKDKLPRRCLAGEQTQTEDHEKYHAKTFAVVNVVDGDTIDIGIADGEYERTRIRLWGIDTPESKSNKTGVMYFGPEASDFTKNLVLGKQVIVYLDAERRTRGKYGRLLAYVQLPDGRFLNKVLVAEGFAYADLRFRHNFYYEYQQLEAVARSQQRGLWENAKRELLPEWLRRKRPKLLSGRTP